MKTNIEAVILAGGKGSRLRPYTTTLPKPLMPVGEQPILGIVIKQLSSFGVKKITLAVNHMADLIMAYFGDGKNFNISIDYSREGQPLGTVGPLKLIKDLPEYFIVMNGDILTNINYNELVDSHVSSGALFTIATFQRDTNIDFGVLEIDKKTNYLAKFIEKPIYHFDVSMGVYVFSKKVLDLIPENTPFGIDDLSIKMLSQKLIINTYPFSGYWLDIGRPDDFDKANEDIKDLESMLFNQQA